MFLFNLAGKILQAVAGQGGSTENSDGSWRCPCGASFVSYRLLAEHIKTCPNIGTKFKENRNDSN